MERTTRTAPRDGGSAALPASESSLGEAFASVALSLAMYGALIALTVAWNWTLGTFGG